MGKNDVTPTERRRFHGFSGPNIAVIVKVGIVVAAIIAIFFPDLELIFTDAMQSDVSSYVLAIPFLIIFIIYRKRKMVLVSIGAQPKKLFSSARLSELVGWLLLAISLLLYWYGSYSFTPIEYHLFALPMFTSATILVVFNEKVLRQILIAILFLFLLIPPPMEVIYSLGSFFSVITSQAAYSLLHLAGLGPILGVESGTPVISIIRPSGELLPFSVDVACSGVYSQIGFLIFGLFIAYLVRGKLWKKAAMFLIGLPLIFSLNIMRVTSLVAIGYYEGYELALNLFHAMGGWVLIFLGTVLLLLFSEKVMKIRMFDSKSSECLECKTMIGKSDFCLKCGRVLNLKIRKPRKADLARIITILIIASLIVSIQVPVFALTSGPAEVITQTAQGQESASSVLPEMVNYSLQFEGRDTDFEQIARQDASLIYTYYPHNDSEEMIYVTIEIAAASSSLHRWETCLITSPLDRGYKPLVRQIELTDIRLVDNPPIVGRYFSFQYLNTNVTRAVLYWFETSEFKTNSTWENRHVKISVIMNPNSLEELPELKTNILTFSIAIANYWQPLKGWSQMALVISQNGEGLVFIFIGLLISVIIVALFQQSRRRKQSGKIYDKLSESNKRIVDAARKAEKSGTPTLENVQRYFRASKSETDEEKEILEKLFEAEKAGILTKDIANVNDVPVAVWRAGS